MTKQIIKNRELEQAVVRALAAHLLEKDRNFRKTCLLEQGKIEDAEGAVRYQGTIRESPRGDVIIISTANLRGYGVDYKSPMVRENYESILSGIERTREFRGEDFVSQGMTEGGRYRWYITKIE